MFQIMKKPLLFTSAISALMLASCFSIGPITEQYEYTADDAEGTSTILEEYFARTLTNTNMVVTVKSNDALALTETIDGEKSSAAYSTGTTSYTYKDGEKYCYAVDSADSKYTMEDESLYQQGRYVFTMFTLLGSEWPADATFSCSFEGEGVLGEKEEDYTGTGTFTLEVVTPTKTVRANGTSKNGLAEAYEVTATGEEDGQPLSQKYNLTFTYGSASVTLPDFSSWGEAE